MSSSVKNSSFLWINYSIFISSWKSIKSFATSKLYNKIEQVYKINIKILKLTRKQNVKIRKQFFSSFLCFSPLYKVTKSASLLWDSYFYSITRVHKIKGDFQFSRKVVFRLVISFGWLIRDFMLKIYTHIFYIFFSYRNSNISISASRKNISYIFKI